MKAIQATIITIGDELLIGQVIDTNSAYIAQALNRIGVGVKNRIAVGDSKNDIVEALSNASKNSNIVILTGGLGPTADDITKPLLNEFFGGKLVIHQPTLDHITDIFVNRHKRPMIERNRKQAEVPDVCEVLFNETGTAPGMLFKKEGVFVFSLPGVPHEMRYLTNHHVIPSIVKNFTTSPIMHRTLLTAGIGESFLAELIADFENNLPENIKLAYLPNFGMVRLRLTSSGLDENELKTSIEEAFAKLKIAVADYLVTDEDENMEVVVGKLLKAKNQTVATAESCTGGFISHLITSVPGSSKYYIGSVISYDNKIKKNELNVSEETLNKYGAVSEDCVKQMADGIRKKFNTDYAIATSGIAGPDGGTLEKPVGTVWIAVSSKNNTITRMYNMGDNRERTILRTSLEGLDLLRRMLLHI